MSVHENPNVPSAGLKCQEISIVLSNLHYKCMQRYVKMMDGCTDFSRIISVSDLPVSSPHYENLVIAVVVLPFCGIV